MGRSGGPPGSFAERRRDGLLPNFYPQDRDEPDYGAIDAPMWFVLAVEWFGRARREPGKPPPLLDAVREIIDAYRKGTSFGIGAGPDLLLSGGAAGRALTWMDAVVDGSPVTPRHGRPVEINALWHAALKASARLERLAGDHARARDLEAAWEKLWRQTCAAGAAQSLAESQRETDVRRVA